MATYCDKLTILLVPEVNELYRNVQTVQSGDI